MNKNVFTYLVKSKKVLIGFVFVTMIALMMTPYLSSIHGHSYYTSWLIGYVLLIGCCFVLPAYLLRFIHSKKASDSYFSLPVSRSELLHTNLLFSMLITYCPFALGAIISGIIGISVRQATAMDVMQILLSGLITVIVLNLVNSMFFSFANTLFDGAVMIAAYTAMPLMVYIMLGVFMDSYVAGMNYWFGLSAIAEKISPLYLCATLFDSPLKKLQTIAILAVYALIAYFMLRREIVDRKVERAEQVSNHFFAYPFVIYFYAFTVLCMITFFWGGRDFLVFLREAVIYYLLLLVIFTIANFVYKRKVRLEPKTFVFFGISILLSLCIGFAANKTQGFGISRMYDRHPKNISYMYNDSLGNDAVRELGLKGDYVSVWFDLRIPSKEIDDPKYSEAIAIMEKNRESAIRDFYSVKETDYSMTGNLRIECNYQESVTGRIVDGDNIFNYTVYDHLDLEELAVISKVTEVTVMADDGTYNLADLIEK